MPGKDRQTKNLRPAPPTANKAGIICRPTWTSNQKKPRGVQANDGPHLLL